MPQAEQGAGLHMALLLGGGTSGYPQGYLLVYRDRAWPWRPAACGVIGTMMQIGTLDVTPARSRPDLLAPATAEALSAWSRGDDVGVAPIDPDLADTAAFCAAYGVPLAASANCVVLAGKRDGQVRMAACLVLATTRADVNGVARRWLDVRKISFAPMDDAVAMTGMEYGGITPVGLPTEWPILIDPRVIDEAAIVIGSGIRGSKLVLPGAALRDYPGVEVIEGLASPLTPSS